MKESTFKIYIGGWVSSEWGRVGWVETCGVGVVFRKGWVFGLYKRSAGLKPDFLARSNEILYLVSITLRILFLKLLILSFSSCSIFSVLLLCLLKLHWVATSLV